VHSVWLQSCCVQIAVRTTLGCGRCRSLYFLSFRLVYSRSGGPLRIGSRASCIDQGHARLYSPHFARPESSPWIIMCTSMLLPSLALRRAAPLVTRCFYPGGGSMRSYSDRPEDGIKVRLSEPCVAARLISFASRACKTLSGIPAALSI
jgi:hypothetical protein